MINSKSVDFKRVFDFFQEDNPYEDVFSSYLSRDKTNVPEFISILGIEDKDIRQERIRALTKKEIEYILYNMQNILDGVLEERLTELINLRYRRYMFRILYVLWQDNYENPKIKRLFLIAIYTPNTSDYLDEISINRKTIFGIDFLSIFFLFCSAKDLMEFGNERLLIAIKRYEMANQAKILNNMIKKLNKKQRIELSEVISYLLKKYPGKDGRNSSFWTFVSPESIEILNNEFH